MHTFVINTQHIFTLRFLDDLASHVYAIMPLLCTSFSVSQFCVKALPVSHGVEIITQDQWHISRNFLQTVIAISWYRNSTYDMQFFTKNAAVNFMEPFVLFFLHSVSLFPEFYGIALCKHITLWNFEIKFQSFFYLEYIKFRKDFPKNFS